MSKAILCPECKRTIAIKHPDGYRQMRGHMAMRVLEPICPRAVVFTCTCGCEFDASGIVIKKGEK